MGLLIAIGLPVYQSYSDRARASEIIERFDELRTNVAADLGVGVVENCSALANVIDDANLGETYAQLAVGFETVLVNSTTLAGFRPVLTVCARDDAQGASGVRVARAALEELSAQHLMESGTVVTDTIVSFALPLTTGNQAVCRIAPSTPLAGCRNVSQRAPAQSQPLQAPTQVQSASTVAPPMLRGGTPQCIPPAKSY